MKTNYIIQGDCVDKLKELPNESIDCVMTSPPYFGLRSYLDKDDPNKKKEIGSEMTMEEHIKVLMKVIGEIKRVLKKTGSFWLNYGDIFGGVKQGKTDKKVSDYIKKEQGGISKNLPSYDKCLMMLPERIALTMIDNGWILRSKIVWAKQIYDKKECKTKGSVMPTSVKDRFNTSWEYLFHFVKNKKYYFDLDAVRLPVQTFDKRPPGVLRQRLYSESSYNKVEDKKLGQYKFNYRVRDAIKKKGQPQFKASNKEIKNYKYQNNMDNRGNNKDGPGSWRLVLDREKRRGHGGNNPDIQSKGKNIPNVWLIGIEPSKELHFARFPQKLCEIPIKSSCPSRGIVLDPFAGSGTVLQVAKKLNRRWLGIELNQNYIEMAEKRINSIPEPML